jgi:hypothetical protein
MSVKINITQWFKSIFQHGKKQNFEKLLFEERLKIYDEQIYEEYERLKYADWFNIEPIDEIMPYKLIPVHLRADNNIEIKEKLNQLKSIRKKAKLPSKKLIEGIELLLEYGIWTNPIVMILDEFISNENIVKDDDYSILSTLIEHSHRAVRNEMEEADYESDELFDFEKYFEENLSLNLKIAGFQDIKLSQNVTPYEEFEDEHLLVYHFTIEIGKQKYSISISSDFDLFWMMRTIFNGLLLELGSNMRFYRLQFCPYPVFLEKELALKLMKQHGILIFNESL